MLFSRSLKVLSSSLKFKFEKGVYSILPLQLTTPTMLPSGEADHLRYHDRYIVSISSFLSLSFVVTELKLNYLNIAMIIPIAPRIVPQIVHHREIVYLLLSSRAFASSRSCASRSIASRSSSTNWVFSVRISA